MQPRTILRITISVFGALASFWLYGFARTLGETVDFHAPAFFSSLGFALFFPFLLCLPFLIRPRACDIRALALLLLAGILAGSAVSETWILLDEAQFATEVSKTDG
ncbi:MAG: hypothetical protein ABI054_12335, partial [Planctomycetota bacterium]